ncbi:MAG: TIGR02466 family protein [Hyphomicrobiaceae bacterium]
MPIENLFVTKIYRAPLGGRGWRDLNAQLKRAALSMASDDVAGQQWSRENGYCGYTSYGSPVELAWHMPEFEVLHQRLNAHIKTFCSDLDYDLAGRPLMLDGMWVNILRQGGAHAAHIHPHAVISGTYYVDVPQGGDAIRFEDPRLAMMMAAPLRRPRASKENKSFITIAPKAGMLLLWESWLRHDVPTNASDHERISISFNYAQNT